MPFVKVYIHFVWSTKNRIPFLLSSEMRQRFFIHIRINAREKGIFIDSINGFSQIIVSEKEINAYIRHNFQKIHSIFNSALIYHFDYETT